MQNKTQNEAKQGGRSLGLHFLMSELKNVHCWSVVCLGEVTHDEFLWLD